MTELKITVSEGFEAVLERAAEAERQWRAGETRGDAATHLNFESWEQLTRTLTPKRLELLRHLHRQPAASVHALARALGRAYANVHADVDALVGAGLIDRPAEGGLRAEYDVLTTRMVL